MARAHGPHTSSQQPPAKKKDQRKQDSRAEDSRLIDEAIRGDNRAYQRLMEKYHDAIYNFIYRMIHDR